MKKNKHLKKHSKNFSPYTDGERQINISGGSQFPIRCSARPKQGVDTEMQRRKRLCRYMTRIWQQECLDILELPDRSLSLPAGEKIAFSIDGDNVVLICRICADFGAQVENMTANRAGINPGKAAPDRLV